MPPLTRGWIAAVLMAGSGCRAASSLGASSLPAADLSLDPARLVRNIALHACGRWSSGAALPPGIPVIVDAYFTTRLPVERPDTSHRRRVLSRAGVILHTFHFAAYRIRIASDSIPSLAERDRVIVFGVVDVTRYDWQVFVGYHKGQPFGSAEEARFVALGGSITSRWSGINALSGVLPDRSLPALRADPRVRYIETNPIICHD